MLQQYRSAAQQKMKYGIKEGLFVFTHSSSIRFFQLTGELLTKTSFAYIWISNFLGKSQYEGLQVH